MKKLIISSLLFLMLFSFAAHAQKKEKVILDTDMVEVFDDGITMMMLANAPNIDLIGVTIVVGNTWVPEGVAYAIRQLESIKNLKSLLYPVFANPFIQVVSKPL